MAQNLFKAVPSKRHTSSRDPEKPSSPSRDPDTPISSPRYYETGSSPTSVWTFADGISMFSGCTLEMILGSYGLMLSNPIFWLCWILLVTKAFNYCIQPYWEWIEDSTQTIGQSEGTKKPYQLSDYVRIGTVILNLVMSSALIALLLCTQDMTQREKTILLIVAVFTILFDGLASFLKIIKELSSSSRNITEGQEQKDFTFLIPSAIDAMIFVTGPIILGGDLGRLMHLKAFWVLCCIFVGDLLAEFMYKMDCRRRFLSVMPEGLQIVQIVVVVILRLVDGCLCCWWFIEIQQDSYFPSNMDINACNKLCKERSKQLLITMVALGGLQVAVIFHHLFRCLHSWSWLLFWREMNSQ